MAYRNALIALLAGALLAPPQARGEGKVLELKALHREGQTFITFKELADVAGEKYDIYRSQEPIPPATLPKAEKLATIGEGSGQFKLEQQVKVMQQKTGVAGYNFRYIIRDNPTNDPKAQLPEGVGLFVLTVKKTGLVRAGRREGSASRRGADMEAPARLGRGLHTLDGRRHLGPHGRGERI
jgi:hypothetical protein